MEIPHIYNVSGGKGLAGEHVLRALLVQFPDFNITTEIESDVLTEEEALKVVLKAKEKKGIVVHTMVDRKVRAAINNYCKEQNVPSFDLMGPLCDYLSEKLHTEPIQVPGLFRKLNQEYFDRIAAIEFTLSVDDGMNTNKIHQADVVLTGVSRAGKTPLSVYMAMLGWKVANVPLVKEVPPPDDLFKVDSRRVFGLSIFSNSLITQRKERVAQMGNFNSESYLDSTTVRQEIAYANHIFERGGFTIIDVTNKPIESTANEIINHIHQRFSMDEMKK